MLSPVVANGVPNASNEPPTLSAPKIDADFKYYQLVIYDRWGKSVYKSENPEEAWDGTINGHAKAADGVYYYVFTYACMSAPDEKISKHGSITLIR